MPFEFHLEARPSFEKISDSTYSKTGIHIRMKRKSLGQLLSGYYYPTTSFALLSMISFLINPDIVSAELHFKYARPEPWAWEDLGFKINERDSTILRLQLFDSIQMKSKLAGLFLQKYTRWCWVWSKMH